MAHIDLYQALGLDRRWSADHLRQVLTDMLATADAPARPQIEVARAILGDPIRRSRYDAQLSDPAAPELNSAALDQIALSPGGAAAATATAGSAAGAASGLSVPLLAAVAVALVVAIGGFAVVMVQNSSDEPSPEAAQSSVSAPPRQPGTAGPSPSVAAQPTVEQPVAPVPGAYVGAGGPRPAAAIPLPAYVSRYGGVKSAHLLTPTGGIGCDFQATDADGKQGACGVRSMSRPDSPLGTEVLAGSRKGKWLFPFKNNVVEPPTSTSGTTGWMNQPANDGYQVPRVEYGKQYYFENWVCASEMNGLTCWNTVTGSGVFLSREKAETFTGTG